MRHELEQILGESLRILAIETRERLHLTQKKMGAELHMSESSYSDIETGTSYCGALTEALLLSMQEDPTQFLDTVRGKFMKWYEKEMQIV